MRKFIYGFVIGILALFASAAIADITVLDGASASKVIKNFVCETTKLCNATVLIKSDGTEIGTVTNPVYTGIRDAAGNNRGANVNSSNQLTVSVDGGSVYNANGQASMANSSPVVLPNNMSAIPLWGHGATGAAPPANATQAGAVGSGATGGLLAGLKTCDLHAKYDASDNGSITMITGVSGRKVYICGFILATGGTATNLKLREGSDANCASNAADLTPAYQLVANDKIGMMSAFWTGLAVSTNAYYVCVNASAGNAHQAEIWYTIQ